MSIRDRAILGSSDLEPDELLNPVCNCPLCGRFTSARLGPHPECEQIIDEQEQDEMRRWSYQ